MHPHTRSLCTAFTVFTAMTTSLAHAAATDLDSSFNYTGVVQDYLDLGTSKRDTFADAALAPTTGAIYTVGKAEYTDAVLGPTFGVLFKRLPNGAKDTTFGNSGASRVTFAVERAGGYGGLTGVDFDASNTGAIAVVGFEDLNNGQRCGVAYKVLDNAVMKGVLHGNFANMGRMTFCSGSGAEMSFSDVKVLPDGRWLISGNSRLASGEQYGFLLRLLTNGQFDPSFNALGINGSPGLMNFNIRPGKDDSILRIALSSNGYYVGGNSLWYDNPDFAYGDDIDLWVAKINANGTLNSTFNNTGIRIEALDDAGSDRTDLLADLAVDATGRVLLLAGVNPGHAIYSPNIGLDPLRFYKSQVSVIRLTSNGQRDVSFGAGSGRMNAQFGPVTCSGVIWNCSYDEPLAMTTTPAGEIWIAGRHHLDQLNSQVLPQIAIGRVSSSGGLLLGQRIQRNYGFEAMALLRQYDGKLVLGGRARTTSKTTDADFFVMRLLGTP